jgi:hypothetical protein
MLHPANRAMILQTDCDSVAKLTDLVVIAKSKCRLGLETAHLTRFGSQGDIPKGSTKKRAIQSFQWCGDDGAQDDGTVDPSDEATPLVDKDYSKPNPRNLAGSHCGWI